jgi:sugar O-acyltransferase (sialic acid O-acetyltransferase NeuD family)
VQPKREKRVLIIGAGGHGQLVADILLRMFDANLGIIPIGFLDDRRDLWGQTFLGVPVLGGIPDWKNIEYDEIIVAIGANATRKHFFQLLQNQGCSFAIARHPMAVVAPDVRIAASSMIVAGAIVNPGATIGEAVILNTGCTVDHHNQIGNYAHIAPGAHLGGEVEVGEGVLIGIGATVMPRKRIGAWSIIGAGALVCQNVPDRSVVIGVPGKVIRKL